jgi:hypothetical protein
MEKKRNKQYSNSEYENKGQQQETYYCNMSWGREVPHIRQRSECAQNIKKKIKLFTSFVILKVCALKCQAWWYTPTIPATLEAEAGRKIMGSMPAQAKVVQNSISKTK